MEFTYSLQQKSPVWGTTRQSAQFHLPHPMFGSPHHCFYYLLQTRTVRRSLTTDSAKTLVHTLIASCLDYCNSMLYQIYNQFCARLIVQKRNFFMIVSHRHSEMIFTGCQCWQKFVYNLCIIIIYKCLHHTAPKYLQELCLPVTTTASHSPSLALICWW